MSDAQACDSQFSIANVSGIRTPPLYAGFFIRLVAFAIDWVLLFGGIWLALAIVFIGIWPLFYGDGSGAAIVLNPENGQSLSFFVLAITFLWHRYFLTGSWQATPGKRLCGIYVARADGTPLDGQLVLKRLGGYFLSLFTLAIGFFMAGWSREKKSLHDIICDTRVLRGRL